MTKKDNTWLTGLLLCAFCFSREAQQAKVYRVGVISRADRMVLR